MTRGPVVRQHMMVRVCGRAKPLSIVSQREQAGDWGPTVSSGHTPVP